MIPYKELIPQAIKSSAADAYLAKRGIESDKAGKLELLVVPARSLTLHPYIDKYVAILIPHWNRTSGRTGYYTARIVESVGGNVATFAKIKEPPKAYNPPGEVPRGYLNPLTNWLEFRKGETIFIAESWSKALAIQACGHKAIGLSGVSNGAPHMTLIPEISDLPVREKKLKFCIVFDSDVFDKEQIRAAMARLAGKIYEKFKVKCEWIPMPHSPGGEKWGFDDMYVLDPVKAARFLDGSREEVQGTELTMKLVDMNDKVCLIEDQSCVAQLNPRIIMSPGDFAGVNYAPWEAVENGKKVSVARAWLKSPIQSRVECQEYMPDKELGVVTDDDGVRKLNTFLGWGCEEKEGDTTIYHDFLRQVIDPYDLMTGKMVPYGATTQDEVYYLADHIFDRFAWMVKNPGKKMNTLTILFGDEGVGKGTLMSPWMHIFGGNSSQISNEQIRSEFNSMIIGKMLVWIDELQKGRGDANDLVSQKIRMLVTEKTVVNRLMHSNPFPTRNCINLWITSNHPDCLKISDGDRRSLVVHVNEGYDRFRELANWIENGGAEALLYEARRRVINKHWDPLGRAYATPWKKGLINASRGWLESKIVELWEDPDSVLLPEKPSDRRRVVYSARELVRHLYDGRPASEVTPGAAKLIGETLERCKFKKACGGVAVRNPYDQGRQTIFWIVRREENDKLNKDGTLKWDDKGECMRDIEGKMV